jgi:nitrous oxidase accessory protein NosD
MPRTLRLLVLGVAALALGLPASAVAVQPQCGDVVTADVTLEADLLECPGDGLVVAAPDVTIDLDFHRVDGTGAGTGIDVKAPDVTIRNGRISDFANGVRLPSEGVGAAWLADLNVSYSDRGVALLGDSPWSGGSDGSVTLLSSRLHHNRIGLAASFWFHQTLVSESTIKANGSGISFRESRGGTVSRSRILGNEGTGVGFDFAGGGRVQANVIDANAHWGLIAHRSSGLILRGNAVTRNGTAGEYAGGAHVLEGSATIEGNTFNENVGPGLALYENLESRSLWPIHRNTANRNTGYGIVAAQVGFAGTGNVAKQNGERAQCFNFECVRAARP